MGAFDELKEAKDLFDQGVLNEDEYQKIKTHLLGNLDNENNVQKAQTRVVTATTSNVNGGESATTGMKILCFLIPLIGIVLFIADKDKRPTAARDELMWAGVGLGFWFMIYFISGAFTTVAYY